MTDHISLQSGTELVGDYRIDRILGAGGFGITYLAEELSLSRSVTIKEYFPSDFAARSDGSEAVPKSQNCFSDYQWGLDRFIEEAQTLARFDHPNIVRVYRYFRANNTGYMVLHFEEGQSLKSWLKGLKRAPRQKELDAIVPNLLEALELIHQADFLHRDIAPDNIIIRKSGEPVLIDFGSARGEIASHSKTVSALVKPGYSPYEQYAETSSKQGPWTDIYALAATLYHAVTGKRPPDAPSRMVVDEIRPAREAAVGAYRKNFLDAIDTALQLKIEARPRSVAAWRRKLMAPDPQKRSWRIKTPDPLPLVDTPAAPAASAAAEIAPASAPSPQIAHDQKSAAERSRGGGLIEFLDGLKSRPVGKKSADNKGPAKNNKKKVKAGANKKPAAKQSNASANKNATAQQSPARPGRISTLLKRLKTSPNPIRVKKSEPLVEEEPRAVPTPKPPRPRRIARRKKSTLRPVVFKLLLGVGAASAAVALQDRFPWPNASTATPITTASISKKSNATEPPSGDRLIRAFSGHTKSITATEFTDDGTILLTAGEDGSLKTWDVITGTPLRTIMLPAGPALSLATHGKRALTSHQDGSVMMWDIESGEKVAEFKRNDARVWSVAFVGDGTRIAASSHDWKTAVWDITDPKTPRHVFDGHKNAAQAVAFANTPRGPVIATASADKTIKLWHGETFKLLRTYRGHRDFVNRIAFSADGRRLASASIDGNVRVWSTRSRRLLRSYKTSSGEVSGLAFLDPNGKSLMTSGRDTTVQIKTIASRRGVKTLETKDGAIASIALSPSAGRLAASDKDGQIELWSLSNAAQLSSR